MAEPLWHSNTNRHSFSSAAPLWGFCCRKRQRHRAVLSDSVMNLNDMCHSADLHGFQQHGCEDVGPVFIPCTANTVEICPRPASYESALITASESLTVLQRSNPHSAINKGWRVAFTGVSSLPWHQTGCRGCTLEPWYFGFPKQQQWTQDSTIRKRNVAEKRHRQVQKRVSTL